jgi:four helix bundle protein
MSEPQTDSQLAAALKARSKRFAVGIIVLCRQFPRSVDALVVAKQLIEAATSVAANYRAACRSRSPADFISKISVVAEEADESRFWLELTIESEILDAKKIHALLRESGELAAIFTASRDTAKKNAKRKQGNRRAARDCP